MGRVDVLAAVRDMGGLLERVLGPSVFLTTRFPLSLPLALTDKAQLESAIMNLAVNARDAMPSGGQIIISAAHRDGGAAQGLAKPGSYVVLSVIDQGEGMDETTLSRATEPFFTTKGVGQGTGLGLSMVHGLAEQSGGKFVLASREGHGTTAELWLPIVKGEEAAIEAAAIARMAEKFQPKRVLVVDDDALVLLNTAAMTEELGHQVFEAMSGMEALKVLQSQEIDVVITDYAMPQMTGGALAATITEKWPHIKIVVATGYADIPDEHRHRFERIGKPFGSDDPRAAIERTAR